MQESTRRHNIEQPEPPDHPIPKDWDPVSYNDGTVIIKDKKPKKSKHKRHKEKSW